MRKNNIAHVINLDVSRVDRFKHVMEGSFTVSV